MPPRPDGKAARVERVTFTRPAADRIAKAVRAVEADAASSHGPTLGYRLDGGPAGKVFRVCTFTGSWSINTSKVLTFKGQTNTPNTVLATNTYLNLNPTTACTVLIAKEGTAWYLAQADLTVQPNYSGLSMRVFTVDDAGFMKWESVSECKQVASPAQISTFLG